MRIINKKYLLIILLVGVILTGGIVLKPNKKVKLDNVVLKQEVNNKTFAMYTETDNGYKEYDGNSFPKGQRLNKSLSKCIDKNGEEIKNAINVENATGNISVSSNKSLSCYLYFDNKIEDLSGNNNNGINHAQLWTEEGITTSIDANNLGYVDCGLEDYDFNDSITIVVRVKFSDLTGVQYIFGDWETAGGGLYLVYPSLTFDLFINNDYTKNVEDKYNFNLNTYYTVVGVYNGSVMSLYINGQKVNSNQVSGNIKSSILPILLGANPALNGTAIWHSYTTFIDALVFDSALNEEEIQAYFSGTINKEQVLNEYVNKFADNKTNQKLLLYYNFD